MSNLDINNDRQTNGKADAYVAKSGGQGDVSCKVFDGCLVLQLIRILTLT